MYKANFDFFNEINTEEKAYWLGFILADGYINSRDNTVGIELKSTDIDHLLKFKKDIEAEHPVKIFHKNSTFGEQDNCRIVITNKSIKSDLLNLGLTTTKSKDGILPNIYGNYTNHMIRGYFDGNGCISTEYRKEYQYIQLSFCGTKEITNKIEEISGFEWCHYDRFPNRNNNNDAILTGKQKESKNFLNWMYNGSHIYLDRKYEKYKNVW